MSSLNKATLIGYTGRDPEIRYTQGGDPVASFSLATTEKWTNKDGQKQEQTQWHSVTVFGGAAKVVREYVKKGSRLYVEGQIVYEEWTDKEGAKKRSTKIRVSGFGSRVILLGNGRRAEESREAGSDDGDDEVPF